MVKTDKITIQDDYETANRQEAEEYLAALQQAMAPTPSYLEQQAQQAADEWNVVLQDAVA